MKNLSKRDLKRIIEEAESLGESGYEETYARLIQQKEVEVVTEFFLNEAACVQALGLSKGVILCEKITTVLPPVGVRLFQTQAINFAEPSAKALLESIRPSLTPEEDAFLFGIFNVSKAKYEDLKPGQVQNAYEMRAEGKI